LGSAELIDAGKINGDLGRVLIRSIAANAELAKLGAASKLNADRRFLKRLRDAGAGGPTIGWPPFSTRSAPNRRSI
jgi:hypothetical protein